MHSADKDKSKGSAKIETAYADPYDVEESKHAYNDPFEVEVNLGAAGFQMDPFQVDVDDQDDDDKINLSLSSGDDVDLTSLPVAVRQVPADHTLNTPAGISKRQNYTTPGFMGEGGSGKNQGSSSAPYDCELKSSSGGADSKQVPSTSAFAQIVQVSQADIKEEKKEVSSFQEVNQQQEVSQSDTAIKSAIDIAAQSASWDDDITLVQATTPAKGSKNNQVKKKRISMKNRKGLDKDGDFDHAPNTERNHNPAMSPTLLIASSAKVNAKTNMKSSRVSHTSKLTVSPLSPYPSGKQGTSDIKSNSKIFRKSNSNLSGYEYFGGNSSIRRSYPVEPYFVAKKRMSNTGFTSARGNKSPISLIKLDQDQVKKTSMKARNDELIQLSDKKRSSKKLTQHFQDTTAYESKTKRQMPSEISIQSLRPKLTQSEHFVTRQNCVTEQHANATKRELSLGSDGTGSIGASRAIMLRKSNNRDVNISDIDKDSVGPRSQLDLSAPSFQIERATSPDQVYNQKKAKHVTAGKQKQFGTYKTTLQESKNKPQAPAWKSTNAKSSQNKPSSVRQLLLLSQPKKRKVGQKDKEMTVAKSFKVSKKPETPTELVPKGTEFQRKCSEKKLDPIRDMASIYLTYGAKNTKSQQPKGQSANQSQNSSFLGPQYSNLPQFVADKSPAPGHTRHQSSNGQQASRPSLPRPSQVKPVLEYGIVNDSLQISPTKSDTENPDQTPGSGCGGDSTQKESMLCRDSGAEVQQFDPFNSFDQGQQPSRRSAVKEVMISSQSTAKGGNSRQEEEAKTFKSPRLNVKQYHSSQPKFKDKLSADPNKQGSSSKNQQMKGDAAAAKENYFSFGTKQQQAFTGAQSKGVTQTEGDLLSPIALTQMVSLPTDYKSDESVDKPNVGGHSRQYSGASNTNLQPTDSALNLKPNDSDQVAASKKKKRHDDFEQLIKQMDSETMTQRRNAMLNQSDDKNKQATAKDITIEDVFTRRLTLEVKKDEKGMAGFQKSPQGTRVSITNQDGMRHVGTSGSPRSDYVVDDNQLMTKNSTIENKQRGKGVQKQPSRMNSPNTMIFRFQTKPKRAKQSSEYDLSPLKREIVKAQQTPFQTETDGSSQKTMPLIQNMSKTPVKTKRLAQLHHGQSHANFGDLQNGLLDSTSPLIEVLQKQNSEKMLLAAQNYQASRNYNARGNDSAEYYDDSMAPRGTYVHNEAIVPVATKQLSKSKSRQQHSSITLINEFDRVTKSPRDKDHKLKQGADQLRMKKGSVDTLITGKMRQELRDLSSNNNRSKVLKINPNITNKSPSDAQNKLIDFTLLHKDGAHSSTSQAGSDWQIIHSSHQTESYAAEQHVQNRQVRSVSSNVAVNLKSLLKKRNQMMFKEEKHLETEHRRLGSRDLITSSLIYQTTESHEQLLRNDNSKMTIEQQSNDLMASAQTAINAPIPNPAKKDFYSKYVTQTQTSALQNQSQRPFTSQAQKTTQATTAEYQTNTFASTTHASEIEEETKKQQINSKSHAVVNNRDSVLVAPEKQLPPSDEFRIYEDKAIHGWLEKERKGYFAGYKRMYIIVDNQKLCYYTNQQLTTQKGVIDFATIPTKLNVVDECTFKLQVEISNGTTKTFTFRTVSKGSLGTWITMINLQMNNAEVQFASERQLSSKVQQKAAMNFWKVCRISSEELIENAQTGDILLFTGKMMQDRILRGVIGSKYDHVGMLVKYPQTNQVLIFESLNGKGVCRWDWQQLKKNDYWKNTYSKIVYRRLLGVERDEQFRSTVQDFMRQTLGKPYKMLSSVLGAKDSEDHTSEKVAAKTGYFCSELVACCLKRLNLLDPSVPATRYWPGCFSTENPSAELKLLNDCFYSEEITLELNH